MKQLTIVYSLIVLGLATASVQAQQPTASPVPHRVGLIDMGYIFKNYKKFEALREDLKAEIQKSDDQAKAMANEIKTKQEQMKQLQEGTPAFVNAERDIARLVSEFETYRKVVQRDFLRKESQIYRVVYLEVTDAVQKYADYYKYTLIIRFNREDVDENTQPGEVIQQLNRQVIYHRGEDDITESVLEYLNRKYAGPTATPGKAPSTAINPAAPPRQ